MSAPDRPIPRFGCSCGFDLAPDRTCEDAAVELGLTMGHGWIEELALDDRVVHGLGPELYSDLPIRHISDDWTVRGLRVGFS
jgi:hypothetical protein